MAIMAHEPTDLAQIMISKFVNLQPSFSGVLLFTNMAFENGSYPSFVFPVFLLILSLEMLLYLFVDLVSDFQLDVLRFRISQA